MFYGKDNIYTKVVSLVSAKQKITLAIIVIFIFVLGIYPKPVFKLTQDTVAYILKMSEAGVVGLK